MPQNEELKIVHNNVEIRYDEGRNRFCFELRGRDRSTDTLQQAREAIDRPVRVKDPDEKPFERIQAYTSEFYHEDEVHYPVVTVTKLAEGNSWGGIREAWTVRDSTRGNRKPVQKLALHHLFPVNEHNTKLVEQIRAKCQEINILKSEKDALEQKLKSLKV